MSMPSQPTRFFPRPFAESGNYQSIIPDTKTIAGRASFTEGFPTETQLPLSQGGVAPNRLDFNGMFNILSAFGFWQQSGGQWTYTKTLNYTVPCIVFHAGKLWWCVTANGPDSGNGVVEPGTNESFWEELLQSLAQMGGSSSLGVPVGTVVTYYGVSAPEGFFSCDGSTFSATQYPQLRSVLGSTLLPDLRGYFVRGYDTRDSIDPDGAGRGVGSTQGDAIRNLTGSFHSAVKDDDKDEFFGDCGVAGNGVFSVSNFQMQAGIANVGPRSYPRANSVDFNAANQVPTAAENRPKNVALLYCIKHD